MPTRPPTFVNRATRQARAANAAAKQASDSVTYDGEWRRLRKRHLADSPLCVRCEREGRITAATEVDHRVPVRRAPERRLDPTNLNSVCKPCHSRKTALENTKRGG